MMKTAHWGFWLLMMCVGLWGCSNEAADEGGGLDCASSIERQYSCGQCGVYCPEGASCVDGQCECGTNLTLCGDACVNLDEDAGNCGACDEACTAGRSCVEGQCEACGPGEFLCADGCVDTDSNANHCGACGTQCPEGAACRGGVCQCRSGQVQCQDGCADTSSNDDNCGFCGNACPDDARCIDSVCQCGFGITVCDGQCTQTDSDPNHCGDCGEVCPQGATCRGGQCRCPRGALICDGLCVDTDYDEAHCGECGNACGDGQECVVGQCRCPVGQDLCDGVCVDVDSDEQHCGACGEACGQGSVCCQGQCAPDCPCDDAVANRSYVGCEYWPTDLNNYTSNDAPLAVVLFNPQLVSVEVSVYGASGEIQQAISSQASRRGNESRTLYSQLIDADGNAMGEPLTGALEAVEVPPGMLLQILLPRRQPPNHSRGQVHIHPGAWKVLANRPVVAYQFNPLCCNFTFTNDASLLLPRSALTGNYLAMAAPDMGGFPGTLSVVGTRDNTQVQLRLPTEQMLRGTGNIDIENQGNGVWTTNLDAHEVLTLYTADLTMEDITGVQVLSDREVAVYGGHHCIYIPQGSPACDHLEEQLFGVETWGTSAVATPLKARNRSQRGGDVTYWKFLARDNGTRIELDRAFDALSPTAPSYPSVPPCQDFLDGDRTLAMDAGQHCEFGSAQPFVANATRPFLLGAIISGQDSVERTTDAGDPSFFLVPPQEQYRTRYAFLTPGTYNLDFMTVTMRQNTTLLLDGEPVDMEAMEVIPIGGTEMQVVHVPVSDGPHVVSGSEPFGLIIYAYDDYVSYAYTGGVNLSKLNP